MGINIGNEEQENITPMKEEYFSALLERTSSIYRK